MRTEYRAVVVAYISFVALAMPGAILGPLWSPYMQQSFNQPIGALGALLLTGPIGYFVGSTLSGSLFGRYSIGQLLGATMLLIAAGFGGYILSPSWELIVPLGLITGLGAGILDGGMNIYFAAHYDARLMNWLHASFGLGALLAPQVVNIIVVANGADWRMVYVFIIAVYVALALTFFATRALWRPVSEATNASNVTVPYGQTLRLTLVWVGIVIFALYGGVENGAGTWSSVFFQGRGMEVAIANNWVTAYWASFTLGRIFFGFIVTNFPARTIIQFCLVGALVGVGLFWLTDSPVNGVGLIIIGFMLAPIFALMVTATQERLGAHAPNAIGFQIAAASVGAGLLPAVMGFLIQNYGESVLPIVLGVFTVIMFVMYLVSQSSLVAVRKSKEEPST